jgi:hypothetical protein
MPESMSVNQQIPFLHHRVTHRNMLVESVCHNCGDFVGASSDQKKLMIAEAAHVCGCKDERRTAEIIPPHTGQGTNHGS